MTTLLISILLIVAIILLMNKRIKIATLTLFVTLICFLLVGNGLVPLVLLKQLQMSYVNLPQPQWADKNAIVLLGAGVSRLPTIQTIIPSTMAYSRINQAAQLYHDCKTAHHQCTIILSGGDALRTGKSEALIYQESMLHLGIKKNEIILEPNSMNTYENAEFTHDILKTHGFDQVILVTSGIHLQRALLYFSHFGIQAKPALADYLAPQIAIIPLGFNFALTDFAIHEYFGMVRYYIYNFLGLNTKVVSSGVA